MIVDDIEDSRYLINKYILMQQIIYIYSEMRREKPCVHLIHGVDISINAGNFLYFGPM